MESRHPSLVENIIAILCLGLGGPGPGHGPIFSTPFGPNLNSISVSASASVHLGHGSVPS